MIENATLIVQSTAIVVSGLGVVASILWNIRVVRRRATVELLLAEQTNPVLLDFRSKFLGAARDGKLESFATIERFYLDPETFCLGSTLNRNDLVATGVGEGTIDERIYKRYWRGSYVRDWIRCKGCVAQWRIIRTDPTLFADFEQLARAWATVKEKALF